MSTLPDDNNITYSCYPDPATSTISLSNTAVTFSDPVWTATSTNRIPGAGITGTLINGPLILNGDNIDERLKRIEALLHIPSRDTELENKYPKLKQIWEEYNKALDQYKIWETLKTSK